MTALSKPTVVAVFKNEFVAGLVWAILNPGSQMFQTKLLEKLQFLPKAVQVVFRIWFSIQVIKRFAARFPSGFPNPTVKLAAAVMGGMEDPMSLVAQIAGCFVGATAGTGILVNLLRVMKERKLAAALAPMKPAEGSDIDGAKLVAIETGVAMTMAFAVLYFIKRGKPLQGVLAIIALGIMGKKYTGPGLDPATVFARSAVANDWTHTMQYLLGAGIGGTTGGLIIRALVGGQPALK